MYSQFAQAVTQYRFKKRTAKSCKPASVRPAEIQGLHRNLARARKTENPDAFFLAKALWPVHLSNTLSICVSSGVAFLTASSS